MYESCTFVDDLAHGEVVKSMALAEGVLLTISLLPALVFLGDSPLTKGERYC